MPTAADVPADVDDLDFMTVAQVAERLRVCQRTVRDWMREGPVHRRLPFVKLPRAVRISRAELNRWLAERRRSHRIDNADRAIS